MAEQDGRLSDIIYLYSDFGPEAPEDGGTIFDRQLMNALSGVGQAIIEQVPVTRSRSCRLPLWASSVDRSLQMYLNKRKAEGALIVISHEALFDHSSTKLDPYLGDVLIVHNFMPRFCFPRRPILNMNYRLGAERYFGDHFKSARLVVFLSQADLDEAVDRYGAELLKKSITLAPASRPLKILARRSNVIHMGGTDGWRAKKLSRLSPREVSAINELGYVVESISDPSVSGFALISDRFSVGFKLKLAEMVWCHDVIASLTDIEKEVRQIAPEYPYYSTVSSVEEALTYFEDTKLTISEEAFTAATKAFKSYGWSDAAKMLLESINNNCI